MLSREHAAGHHSVGRCTTYLQRLGGLIERNLATFSAVDFSIDRNAMAVPKAADMGARPGGTMRRQLSGAVQNGGDCVVRQLPRQYANKIDDIGCDRPSSMASLVLLDLHLSMITPLPMNDEHQAIIDDIDDNFFDKQPDDLFAGFD
jgi:hypothetical protein